MVRNEEKYEQAVTFRKRGFTLEEIAKICGVSKSTVSKWLKNKAFSDNVTKQNKRRAGQENAKRLKLVNKARSGERSKRYAEVERSAKTEYRNYKNTPLFVASLTTYRALGDTSDSTTIRLSSTDAGLHRLFIKFAVGYLGADKKQIKHWLLLYQGQSEAVCMKKWQKATTLPYSQFHKTQYAHTTATKKTLHNGVGNTIIGSTVLKRKLNSWIKLAEKDLTT
jgi:transcriptional regulator with XRE-family HTH domain